MSNHPEPLHAYRSAREPRLVVQKLGYAWRTLVVSVLLGVPLLAAAGGTWRSHCTAQLRHRRASSGCPWDANEETVPLTIEHVLAYIRRDRELERRVVGLDFPLHAGTALLLVMALVALLGPQLLTERATLTLDEREGRVRIVRRRLGRRRSLERPLADLREALLEKRTWETTAQLVFRGGEKLDVAAPTNGDAGHAKLVSAVNEMVRPKTA